jgi:hypothetical protein
LDPPRCDDADVLGAFLGGILGYIGRRKGKWMDDMTRMRSVIVDLFLGSGRSTRRYEMALCTKFAAGWRVLL